MDGHADLATVGAAIGDPARALMLNALLGGRALPATDLARIGRVAPSTASGHLARLADARLVEVERQGRHRYYRLAGADVAHALEALAAVAPTGATHSLSAARASDAERAGRSCYDHLAGQLGMAVTDALVDAGALERSSLALADPASFTALGIDAETTPPGRRPLTRACLDWSERRHHLAGHLGAALLDSLLDRAWVTRAPRGRALRLTDHGRRGLDRVLGVTPR